MFKLISLALFAFSSCLNLRYYNPNVLSSFNIPVYYRQQGNSFIPKMVSNDILKQMQNALLSRANATNGNNVFFNNIVTNGTKHNELDNQIDNRTMNEENDIIEHIPEHISHNNRVVPSVKEKKQIRNNITISNDKHNDTNKTFTLNGVDGILSNINGNTTLIPK